MQQLDNMNPIDLRMFCLAKAVELFKGNEIGSAIKPTYQEVIDIAKEFEDYILGQDEEEFYE